jgi:hypothetical protein
MTEEQRLADNEIYKRMWRILESKEAGNELTQEDEEFFKENLKKITKYYEKNFYKWKRVSSQIRIYDIEVYDFADVMTAEEWKEAVDGGWFNNDDGSGYWVKDGKECKDAEVFHSPQLDATHVAWYNK